MADKSLVGCIGFSGPRTGGSWLQVLIKFFTKSKWSHSFVVFFPVEGESSVFEAQMAVCTTALSKYRSDPNCIYEIYSLTNATPELMHEALIWAWHEFAGDQYGFFQLPYFVVKYIYDILHLPMSHLPDWVRNGIICSELSDKYQMRCVQLLTEYLGVYDPDLVSPQNLYDVVKAHPEQYHLEESQ